jgi:hypothetical protein
MFIGRPRLVILSYVNNVIFIEFYNKQNFPKGAWMSEPDLCAWEGKLPCLVLRDMNMGIWKGFVGLEESHPYHGKALEELLKIPETMEIFFSVYGGLSGVGRLPAKYKEFAKNYWWVGIETSHGGDLMPLITYENVEMKPGNQTYKDLKFIRKETNKLASALFRIK